MNYRRESNLELLRIFAAFLIIVYHYVSTISYGDTIFVANRVVYCALGLWGGLGVDLFIMISCWFLSKEGAKYSVAKIWELCKIVIIYSLAWYMGMVIHGDMEISIAWILKMFLTPFIGTYWFATAFIVFYMMCPLLNSFVNNLTDEQLKKAALVLSVAICGYHSLFGGETALMGVISTFVYLYILMAYLRRTKNNIMERHSILFAAGVYTFMVAISFCLFETGKGEVAERIVDRGSAFLILLAVSIFYVFKNLKIRSRLINLMAGSVFSVYILHQYWWGQHYLWEMAGVIPAYQRITFFFHMIGTSCVIFLSCLVVDLIRRSIDIIIKKTTLSKMMCARIDKMNKYFTLDREKYEHKI